LLLSYRIVVLLQERAINESNLGSSSM